ncbi:hypothetical protein [Lentzea sp. CA-135723]|uniref:hypothetical protein n=1 Tax=Lentzea sp. CA-135723 TaxID=3239950 RepID=UPI003D919DAF
MRILASAQACGFGPVSKLVAVSTALGPGTVDFVGQGVALDFARRNADRFGRVLFCDTAKPELVRPHLAETDVVISVMDADLVFWAVREGRPVLLFDSLLGFWDNTRGMPGLARAAEVVRTGDLASAQAAYEELGPHERILLAHLLATRSFVQNFPGVPARVAELAAVGADHVDLCGPIVDVDALHQALSAGPPDDPADLLVNLGGFKNFYLDYDSHNAYLDLMRRWVLDLAAEADLEHIVVCCGGFAKAETVVVNQTRVDFTFLPHDEFLRHLAFTPSYAVPPSLTSLHEAVLTRRMPLLLPEQHYGHVVNRRMLGDIAVGRHAAAFTDVGPRFEVAEDDFEGTRQLDELTREVMRDDQGYQEVRALLDARLAAYRATTPEQRDAAVDELGGLLDGIPLEVALGKLDLAALGGAPR